MDTTLRESPHLILLTHNCFALLWTKMLGWRRSYPMGQMATIRIFLLHVTPINGRSPLWGTWWRISGWCLLIMMKGTLVFGPPRLMVLSLLNPFSLSRLMTIHCLPLIPVFNIWNSTAPPRVKTFLGSPSLVGKKLWIYCSEGGLLYLFPHQSTPFAWWMLNLGIISSFIVLIPQRSRTLLKRLYRSMLQS